MLALTLAANLFAANPVEVGTVEWRRDFQAALQDSARSGTPVFAFFQEVPGCVGCQKFGRRVMSDRFIVPAVEDAFIPVLIYNNRGGQDARILKRYDEPAWNYQVIRFLDGEGKDIIPRKDRVWSRVALTMRMIRALEVADRPVPRYLEAVAYESDEQSHETAAFAQACFWTGEVKLGRVPGVLKTRTGWLGGREVVDLEYDPTQVDYGKLVRHA